MKPGSNTPKGTEYTNPIKAESQVVRGYYLRLPDFRTIMEIRDLPEGEQVLLLLSRCLRSGYNNPLFQTPDELNEALNAKTIINLSRELSNLIQDEFTIPNPTC